MEDVAAASHSKRPVGGSEGKEHSPREALEAVRERVGDEAAVVADWYYADTKAKVLTINLTAADSMQRYAPTRQMNATSTMSLL